MDASRRALAVMCRAPVLGAVKTRIAAALGDPAALALHLRLVQTQLERVATLEATRFLWSTESHPVVDDWSSTFDMRQRLQIGDNLGERMSEILDHHLQAFDAVVLIGTDCPALDGEYVQRAFARLEDSEVVIGPAEDGGYGLIGARTRCSSLFEGVDWGTDRVLTQTLARADEAGLEVALLPEIWDVDRPEDVKRFESLSGTR